jgi:dCMP deaminase
MKVQTVDWNDRIMSLAEHVSTWSKDPSSKIGAVAVDPISHRILSTGYNGFPRGILDTVERLQDRPTKYKLIVHAEQNCIYNAASAGVSLHGAHIYVHGLPVCSDCAKAIISVGIRRVYVKFMVEDISRWAESWDWTKKMFEEANVEWICL